MSNISLDPGFHFDEVDPTTSNTLDAATHRLLAVNPGLAPLLSTQTTLDPQTNVIFVLTSDRTLSGLPLARRADWPDSGSGAL